MNALIRPAIEKDLAAIGEIYNYYVLYSTATFAETPCSATEQEDWWQAHGDRYPVLVAEGDSDIVGWASLSPYIERCAYRFTAEVSIYIRPEMTGQGLGSCLLENLLDAGRKAGLHTVLAIITTESQSSLRLHAKAGFQEVGRLKQVGYKFDRWCDTAILQLLL
ncbi:GNAT family N-acetyltransferase [Geitlerinema sp. PCC 9228]|uniref:GNAT family N-acetyltransferase n=1 Tax=Geitlerinema sp. PCC 9228 TaxID=111611 RepID=UPI0008F99D14|nr:GNAT family N-acetyltransferase [Geitlerinema sp. PCC 9228]